MPNFKTVFVFLLCCLLFIGCETAKEKEEAYEAKQKLEAENKAKRIKEILGDEIPCNIATVGQERNPVVKAWNSNISDIKCYINRKQGILTIDFNYTNRSKAGLLKQFLVRLFDENGQYLTHFVTSEYYTTTSDAVYKSNEAYFMRGGYKLIKVKKLGNILQYPINMRDAAFVAAVEFGWYVN